MSPTRRDTLKAAGAASGLAMLGGHAVAQRDGTEGDGPEAQTLEEGQAAVRFGHFVSGAPAVNVWLVPSDESGDSEMDTDEIGGSGTDDTGTGNETGGTGGNTSGGNTSGNTSEDLQFGNDTNESDAGNQTGGMGGNATGGNATGNETDGGVGTTLDREGQLIAENVSFSEVSDYANVQAGDYTIQLVEVTSGDTTDTGSGTAGNETGDMGGNASGGNTSGNTSEDLQFGNDTNESDAGNQTGGNATGNGSGGDGNESDDGMFSGGLLDDVGGDGSDDNVTGGMADNETGGMGGNATGNGTGGVGTTDDAAGGEVIFEEEITVGETYYTVAAAGSSVDEIDLHLLRDYDAAQVRLVHAAPDAPGVDVVAPDANMTLFDDVTFGQATDYVGVPPGSYSLSVREATDMNDGSEVGAFDVEVESGQAYSVYAVGSPSGGEEEFDLVVLQDGQGADAGLGQDGAPGQQGEPGGPGASGNETGGPSGDGPPGQDNETGGPGRSAGAGAGRGRGNATDATGTDEPGGPGGAAGPNDPGNGSGGNASGNDSDDGDGGGILSF